MCLVLLSIMQLVLASMVAALQTIFVLLVCPADSLHGVAAVFTVRTITCNS